MEKDKIQKTISLNLLTIMNQRGWSTADLTRRCKVGGGTISKILAGNTNISVAMAIKLAEALEVPITVVLEGILEKEEEKLFDAPKVEDSFFIGIMSINNRRFTCIKNYAKKIVGTSELEGGLDLTETTANLFNLIKQAINEALPIGHNFDYKNASLNLVTQSYEFEETRQKFKYFAQKYFKEVTLLPDWQITYWATFGKKEGISLIVDKGVSLSYLKNGSLKKLGGWKFPAYDLGGENWLGVETIRHTIQASEGYIPISDLAQTVLAKFNGKLETIIETCFKGSKKDDDIYCLFADILLRAYLLKSKEARAIVEYGIKMIYQYVQRADEILKKQVKISLSGSLTDIYRPFFSEERLITPPSNGAKVELLTDISEEFLLDQKAVSV